MESKSGNVLTHWMAENGVAILRISIGVIFLWFGVLKFFSGVSPMESLSVRTVDVLTFHMFSGKAMAVGLASLESLIGLGLLTGKFLKATLILLLVQLLGAISPVVIFPAEVFNVIPIVPTLAGQYIIKDIVLISAGILIGGTVRGGKLIADPQVANRAKVMENQKLDDEKKRSK